MILSEEDIERFWSKVNKKGPKQPHMKTRCYLWTGTPRSNREGDYGVFKINGKQYAVHRVSIYVHGGTIPKGLLSCHKCDVRACVRGSHLFVGTYSDNTKDAYDKGRIPQGFKSGKLHRLRLFRHHIAVGKRNGSVTHPEKVPKGETHCRAVLTAAKVIEIRKRFDDGERPIDIAPDYGITRQHVSKIGHRVFWKHLTETDPMKSTEAYGRIRLRVVT